MALHMCAGCQAISHLRKCEACGVARYCGRDCQRAHWKSHREACRAVASARCDGRPNREENKKVVSAIVKALPNALRACGRDLVHIIVYSGPSNVKLDLTKALSGEVPSEHLSVHIVDLRETDSFC